MKKRMLLLVLGLMLALTVGGGVTTSETNAKPSKVPSNAIFYELNSTYPSLTFELPNFVPDNLTGYYNCNISVMVWIGGSDDSSGAILVYNLWNKSDGVHRKEASDMFHSTFYVQYSKPTSTDPAFSVLLVRSETEEPLSGWVNLQVEKGGTTEQPDGWEMPEHGFNSSATNNISTSSEREAVIPLGWVVLAPLVLALTKSRRER